MFWPQSKVCTPAGFVNQPQLAYSAVLVGQLVPYQMVVSWSYIRFSFSLFWERLGLSFERKPCTSFQRESQLVIKSYANDRAPSLEILAVSSNQDNRIYKSDIDILVIGFHCCFTKFSQNFQWNY